MPISHTTPLTPAFSQPSVGGETSTQGGGNTEAQQKMMPHPGNLYDSRWPTLPQSLQNSTLARFDQKKCLHNHGISERAMCAGMSISWLKMMAKGDQDLSPRQSIERMSHLASFEGVVKARVAQNYYTSEQKFLINHHSEGLESIANIEKLRLGNASLIEAAQEMEQITLKAQLSHGRIPLYPMVSVEKGTLKSNPAAPQVVTDAANTSQQGVFAVYSDQGAHAMAFQKRPDNDDLVIFDPNHGEFKTTVADFHTTVDQLSKATGITPLFVQVFAHSA